MPRVFRDPVQTGFPIQAPDEEPIINSPYYEPAQHWAYSNEGKAQKKILQISSSEAVSDQIIDGLCVREKAWQQTAMLGVD